MPSSNWTRRDFLETSLKTGAVVAAVPAALQSQNSIAEEAVPTTGPNIAGAVQTLNQDGSNGEPYVNHLPGRTELFLVIPIREWDDDGGVSALSAQ